MLDRKILGIGIAAALVAGFGYGQLQYERGHSTAQTAYKLELAKLNEQARAAEIAAQTEMEKVRHDANEQKQISDAAIASAHSSADRLRRTITDQKRQLATAQATARAHASAAACWGILDESIREYEAVARDADGLVERLRIGQGWARVIESAVIEQ
ncbi:hypothetical protein JHL22_04895 [Advenella sp. WQ 585]|uniref:Uncharacterized protein n=1 Tax=Advenella mandrilli TaxID=2800330 RepID=A0ABS1E9T2_9BURK|nr:hypothetical protein [Advenella mandrilli]MBK1780547.1 hypothetical protein [Advenella mandrilli]